MRSLYEFYFDCMGGHVGMIACEYEEQTDPIYNDVLTGW